MSKFRFRFETLRRLRQVHRDQQRAELADAYRAADVLSQRRDALAAERAELRAMQQAALADQAMDVNRLMETQRYAAVLTANEQHLMVQTAQLAVETERRRLAVVEADRDVKALDRLEQHQQQQHRQQQQRREIKQLDEVATNRRWMPPS